MYFKIHTQWCSNKRPINTQIKKRQKKIEAENTLYSVSQKKLPPPYDFCQFLPNGWEFLIEILHTYYAFKYTIDCQILSNYLQILQSYAALSATTPRILSLS